MEIFKQASQQKVRFTTKKGLLSAEQLWDLSVTDLNEVAVALDSEYEQSGKKSFLTTRSVKDKTAKLKFDVVIDVLNTKVDAEEVAKSRAEKREKNKKIIALIAEKQDESLKNKSVKQLEAMLEDEE